MPWIAVPGMVRLQISGPMPEPPSSGSPATGGRPASDRLESWKEIATYLRRDVTTVQRWEKREGMPVHRHQHDRLGTVYAFRAELDAWARSRRLAGPGGEPAPVGPAITPAESHSPGAPGPTLPADVPAASGPAVPDAGTIAAPAPAAVRRRRMALVVAVGLAALVAMAVWSLRGRAPGLEGPLANALFQQLTDFEGIEQAAAISRDGRFVTFQSDQGGRMDIWVTQVGTGRFSNLTAGTALELVNPSVRTLGFSPDGSQVTFWARARSGVDRPEIGIWTVPLLGGPPRPFLEGVAELDWAPDGERLAYHTPGPGDPMFIRGASASDERQIFSAPAGLHSHFLAWSPDQAFIYFVQGVLPDRLDVWRIRPAGGPAERVTHHDAWVSHPVFLDARTLLYLATDPDGSGPWIRSLDVATGVAHRIASGLDRYTSLSASADGRRIVATRANPTSLLWRVPLAGDRADLSGAARIPLTTGNATSPRLGPDFLLYVSSRPTGDSLWKLQAGTSTELWTEPGARIAGAPSIDRTGRRIAFTSGQRGRTGLVVMNADGSGTRMLAGGLTLQGAPAWAPDGESITVGARVDGAPRLFRVPVDGSAPLVLVREHSMDPVWSPGGDRVLFSGPDVGTTFQVHAAVPDGSVPARPVLTLTRGARHLVFLPGRRAVLALRGEIGHKNLRRIDLETGAESPVLDLPADLEVRDFDLSPDGRELVLEQVKDHADLVVIDLPRR